MPETDMIARGDAPKADGRRLRPHPEHRYVVRGHWPFPLDMLRHDGSRPASDADRTMVERLSGEYAPDRDAFVDVEIKLVGPSRPNSARWESWPSVIGG